MTAYYQFIFDFAYYPPHLYITPSFYLYFHAFSTAGASTLTSASTFAFSTLSPSELGSELISLSFDTFIGSLGASAFGSSYYTSVGFSSSSSSVTSRAP